MGLMLDLQPGFGRALVVGGGAVATRKVRNLSDAEFEVTVVAPVVSERIRVAPHVRIIEREWQESDLEGHAVVFACTDSREVNRLIGEAARRRGLLVLVADRQGESTFFNPAVLRQGEVRVAVSTGGASPELAKQIRSQIAEALGRGWARVALTARQEREARRRARMDAVERAGVMRAIELRASEPPPEQDP
jgi:siroheme synthase-like protein